ncbi:MAG: ATP synthase F1 subunit delta, partial [Deltaproteobacteria bacterium]|nr:ATP synthase F1 subunit delta [Deltaproteobacteria bacterium]
MSLVRVTRRYVQGLIEAAQAENAIDAAERALATIDAALAGDRDFRSLLFHPMIARSRKKDLLRKIVGDAAPPVVTSFTDFVIEKKREHIFTSVYAEFRQAADTLRGVMRARVTAAYEPAAGQQERLKSQLEQALGKKVILDV